VVLPGAARVTLRYILSVSEVEPDELAAVCENLLGPQGKEAYVTGLEILEERARSRGRQEGREEGREEGRLVEARAALGRVLARRGLALSPTHEARIASCSDLSLLERWLDDAVVAVSVDDVLK
jgi:hypothetical protein